jgi:hypothetical protein
MLSQQQQQQQQQLRNYSIPSITDTNFAICRIKCTIDANNANVVVTTQTWTTPIRSTIPT